MKDLGDITLLDRAPKRDLTLKIKPNLKTGGDNVNRYKRKRSKNTGA